MKKYFTSLDLENNKFVGSLHDPDTNNVIYKTKSYNSQSQVTADINQYLTNLKTNENRTQPAQETIVNTAVQLNIRGNLPRKCCNRH